MEKSVMNETKVYEVELRSLDSLLRKKLGDDLILIDHKVESLLPLGENYGSTILKVQATIKRNSNAKEEELNLVAKMLPATEFQRLIFDSPFTFRKEAFFYEELIPAYQNLEREFGVEDDEIFNIGPEFYGARFSLKSDVYFDDDAVILMENLKIQGYYTADRQQGMDFEHAKMSTIALARFHALGMAMKKHKPEFFEVLKVRSKCLELQGGENFDDASKFYLNIISEDPEISQYFDRVKVAMDQESAKTWTAKPPEPWSTIIHADFWINNFLFHKNPSNGKIDDIKFVDFQNFLFLSPLRELTFYLTTNFNADVMDNKFDELYDCYYENFIKVLKRMKCDVEPFSRDKFDARMKIDAFEEFPHCPFMLNIMTKSVDESDKTDIKDRMMNGSMNPMFKKRLRMCVKKFGEKGWLDYKNEN